MNVDLQPEEFEEERKSGDYRYTQFTYQSIFEGNLMELHPNIRLELTSFMQPYPHEKRMLGSFIERYLNERGMQNVIREFGLDRFELNVLLIERTVIEKLASLIRMSYDPDIKEIQTKTRHLYDLLMTNHVVRDFYNDDEKLTKMVATVKNAEYDSRFKDLYPIENKWQDAPLFTIIDDPKIEVAYQDRFGAEFVYGKLPAYAEVRRTIIELQSALIRCDL